MLKIYTLEELFAGESEVVRDNWLRIIEDTKIEIANALHDFKTPSTTIYYAYTKEGEEKKFDDFKSLCNYLLSCDGFTCSVTTVRKYAQRQWNYKYHLLSTTPLEKDEAKSIYENNLTHGHTFVLGKKTPIYAYDIEGRLVGVYDSKHQYSKVHKMRLVMRNPDVVKNNRLLSENRYDEETAKQKYADNQKKERHYRFNIYKDNQLVISKATINEIAYLLKKKYAQILYLFKVKHLTEIEGYVFENVSE